MQARGMTPDPWQAQVVQSQAPKVAMCCSRQSGKTQLAAALSLATAMQEAGSLVLMLAPSLRQSAESFRAVLDLYKPWAVQMPSEAESSLRIELTNGSRIISLPGSEQNVRGFSKVRLLVVDEAARVLDELFYAIRPMLAVSSSRIIALSTPWGKRGWFFEEWTAGLGWERIRITADQCPRIPSSFLEDERRSLPPLWFRSEYLAEFCDTADSLFSYDDVMAAVVDVPLLWGGGR
jgi:hypothetical protein